MNSMRRPMNTTQTMDFDLEAYARMDAEGKEKYLLSFYIHPDPNSVMNEREVAEFLRMSVRKLRKMRRKGEGPAAFISGKKAARYQYKAVAEWINQRPTQRPTPGVAA